MALQRLPDKALFLVHRSVVEDGLDCMSPLLVTTNIDEVILDKVEDTESLLDAAVGKQSLKEVIPVLVNHDV
jgi:hypothetical protein